MDREQSLKILVLLVGDEGVYKKPGKSRFISPKESMTGRTSGSPAKENTQEELPKAVIYTWLFI
jgi:hypothetical protein